MILPILREYERNRFNTLFLIFSGTKKAPQQSVNKVKRKGGQNVTIGGKVVGKTTKGIN